MKGRWCRADLPGCCPMKANKVLFFHSTKTGGTSVTRWLRENASARAWRLPPPAVNETSVLDNYNCGCGYLRDAMAGRSLFSSGQVLSSHMSLHILDYLSDDDLRNTVVVVSARDPVQRAASGYHFLRDNVKRSDVAKFPTLDHWIQNAGSVEDRRTDFVHRGHPFWNGMTFQFTARRPRGSCCANFSELTLLGSNDEYNPAVLLATARKILEEKICSVIIAERMDDSINYLRWVLGWGHTNTTNVTHDNPTLSRRMRAPGKRHVWKISNETAAKIVRFNEVDIPLFIGLGERLDLQLAAMRTTGLGNPREPDKSWQALF
jgi:hypothetical protein